MGSSRLNRPLGVWVVAFIATVFGLLTLKSGGSVLFIDGIAREEAGNYAPFVLWFNFFAGFSYLLAGAGLFLQKQWAAWLSILIASASAIVFLLLGLHILDEGLFETRTVVAMTLRTGVWACIAVFAYRKMMARPRSKGLCF